MCGYLVQEWENFMTQKGVPRNESSEAISKRSFKHALGHRGFISQAVADSDIDILGALAVSYSIGVLECTVFSSVSEHAQYLDCGRRSPEMNVNQPTGTLLLI